MTKTKGRATTVVGFQMKISCTSIQWWSLQLYFVNLICLDHL